MKILLERLRWPFRTPSMYKVPKWQWITLAALFVIGLALNNTRYLPLYGEINFLDEIVYVSTGKNFIDGTWWPYNRGPLISYFYAIIYPIANLFPNWVLVSDVIGRILSYAGIFLACWLIGRELQFRRLSHPLVLIAALTAVPPFIIDIHNPSYALFIAFSCFAFWGLLLYLRTQSRYALVMTSVFAGCAMLVRPDAIMGATFVFLLLINTRYWLTAKVLEKTLLLAAGPMALMVIIAIVLVGIKTHIYSFGGGDKLYNTFESAQQILVNTDGMLDFNAAAKGKEESEKYFGTAKENHNSVLRAVMRNPARFVKLVWVNTTERTLPMFAMAYGGRLESRTPVPILSWFVGIFTLRGLIELVRRRNWSLLTTLIIVPAQLLVYAITYSFPSYLEYPCYVVFMLLAIGLWAMVPNLGNKWERLFAIAMLACIYFVGAPADWPALAIVGGIALVAATAFLPQLRARPGIVMALATLGLMAMNLPDEFRHAWPGPENGYEKQAAFLKEHFTPHTPTMAFPAPAAVLAKMDWRGLDTSVGDIHSQEDLRKMIQRQHIGAVLVDPFMMEQNYYGWWTTIQKYGPGYLTKIWQSEDGKFQVLVPRD